MRRPFTFQPFPDSTAGSALVQLLVRLFGLLSQAIPNGPSVRTLTVATTLKNGLEDEHGLIRCDASAGAFAVTLPQTTQSLDTVIHCKKSDASVNAVTVTAASGDTIQGAASVSLGAQWASVRVQARVGGWDILSTT